MSYFKFKIDPREGAYIKSLNKVHSEWESIVEDFKAEGISLSELARKLGVNKSVLSRRLKGETNVTLRSLSDIAWLSDKDLEIRYVAKDSPGNRIGVIENSPNTSAISPNQVSLGETQLTNTTVAKIGAAYIG